MRMLYVWTWSWVEDFSSTLRTCILWKGPEGWNIAAHLLNNWGHLHSSSGPAVALKALPRADSRIAWESSLSLIPVSHTSKDHRLQDSSRPKTPQALCFKHKISHLACSHTPSKGHLHPHNYDSGPHRTEYLMSHSQAVWKATQLLECSPLLRAFPCSNTKCSLKNESCMSTRARHQQLLDP